MIDRDLIDRLDYEDKIPQMRAIIALASGPLIGLMEERLLAQLSQGPVDEAEDVAIMRLRKYRLDISKLRALKSLGESLQKDYDDEA